MKPTINWINCGREYECAHACEWMPDGERATYSVCGHRLPLEITITGKVLPRCKRCKRALKAEVKRK